MNFTVRVKAKKINRKTRFFLNGIFSSLKIYEQEKLSQYSLFYRLDNGKYLVVIVKKTLTGNYFSTMYSTGTSIRNAHKDLKEIKP